METLLRDVRLGFRALLRNPGFTLISMLTLALGIGANTAIFSVVDGVLLRALPFPEPERLVEVWGRATSPAEFVGLRDRNRTLERIAGYQRGMDFTLTGAGAPVRVRGTRATADFFTVLGSVPSRGRAFAPGDDRPSAPATVVLSHGLWQERFGGAADVLGKTLVVDGMPRTVIGVMPADFHFPDRATRFWLPAVLDPAKLGDYWGSVGLRVVGRLPPGSTREAATADVRAVGARLRLENPLWTPAVGYLEGVGVAPLREVIVGGVRTPLLLLLGAVGLVLLIACVNVANLWLARAASRSRETAIRTALGASRARLVRQFLTESMLLAGAGAALGLLGAAVGLRLLLPFIPADMPRLAEVAIDRRVFGFTVGLAALTGICFGLIPALAASGAAPGAALRRSGSGAGVGRGQRRAAGVLVVSQLALAVVLTIGAGLLAQSFWRLRNVEPGFRTERVVTARIDPINARYEDDARATAFYGEVLERVAALPGVQAAGATDGLPLRGDGHGTWAFRVDGVKQDPGNLPMAFYQVVTPGYLATLGVPLLRGRPLTEADRAGTAPVVLVSEALARRFWPGQDPIGKRIGYPYPSPWLTVVGVVGNVSYRRLDAEPAMAFYRPFLQAPTAGMMLAVRTSSDPHGIVAGLRAAVAATDPDAPVSAVQTMNARVTESVAGSRFAAVLVMGFAGVALALGALGIYGVISHAVGRRSREFGVRIALGARADDVVRMVAREGAALATVGAVLGVAGAAGATWVLRGLLFEVSPLDPLTFTAVPFLLVGIALLASYLPARRTTRLDPAAVLRAE